MGIQKTDLMAIFSKGLLGAIPFVGPLAAEIVSAIIPNQRIDRIESFLRILEAQIEEKDKAKIQKRITTPESVDLIEDGFIQASRALSEERKEYIAALLKNSLTDEALRHIEYKRLLSILSELNDLEILILKSYSMLPGTRENIEFFEKHVDVLTSPLSAQNASLKEIDKNAIHETHKMHLISLGLLEPKFRKPKRGEYPEFDEKTGMIKVQSHDITWLGKLLLRSIDQGSDF